MLFLVIIMNILLKQLYYYLDQNQCNKNLPAQLASLALVPRLD